MVFRKSFFWRTIAPFNLRGSGPKFTKLFALNARGNAVLHQVFRLWISVSAPDIFALKVGRCPKSGQI